MGQISPITEANPTGCLHQFLMLYAGPWMLAYSWVFGPSCVVAFLFAFGIGANDVANRSSTSRNVTGLQQAQ